MAFFYYVQNPQLTTSMFHDELLPFTQQNTNHNFYSPQNIFVTPNFNTAQLNYTELPCYPSQQEVIIQTTHSIPQIIP
jgi:hypothetical protein